MKKILLGILAVIVIITSVFYWYQSQDINKILDREAAPGDTLPVIAEKSNKNQDLTRELQENNVNQNTKPSDNSNNDAGFADTGSAGVPSTGNLIQTKNTVINNDAANTAQPTREAASSNDMASPPAAPVPVNEQPAPQPAPEIQAADGNWQLEMLNYVNYERSQAGLPPLQLSQSLSQGAGLKSQDMVQNSYFSHTSPTYGSAFQMMKSLGVSYQKAGENIAKNTSVKGAH